MAVPYLIVDAFTSTPFAGNPAAVVLVEGWDDAWMQSVATEMNLSETAFVDVSGGRDSEVLPLRWLTPTTEVDLCGHATLAAAHAMGGSRTFTTSSGELRCDADDGWITMQFPADPSTPVSELGEVAPRLEGLTVNAATRGTWDLLLEVDSVDELQAYEPDFDALRKLSNRGVIVTARSERPDVDFVSRGFYPAVGVPEDPVTGSAHCTLASWWSVRLGKKELTGYQASTRGGTVRMSVQGDRVHLSGQAVTVATGSLHPRS